MPPSLSVPEYDTLRGTSCCIQVQPLIQLLIFCQSSNLSIDYCSHSLSVRTGQTEALASILLFSGYLNTDLSLHINV